MDSHLKTARFLTHLLENNFRIGKFSLGFDPIIGAIPYFGDVFTMAISFYLVWIGIHLKLPQEKIIEMVGNVLVDFFLGIIPVVGDFADVAYRANTKNLKILETYTSVIEGEMV